MHLRTKPNLIAVTCIAGVVATLLILFIVWRFCVCPGRRQVSEETRTSMAAIESRKGTNHLPYRHGATTTKPTFRWANHPDLVTNSADSGWARFAFVNHMLHSEIIRSSPSSVLGFRDHGRDFQQQQVEVSWEVGQATVDLMQRIRLNKTEDHQPDKKRKTTMMIGAGAGASNYSSFGVKSAIKTALPLPAPASSFPQEAYFEITVLDVRDGEEDVGEGEKTKLIHGDFDGIRHSKSLLHVSSTERSTSRQGFQEGNKIGGRGEAAVNISLGLATAGSLPLMLPGCYPGSIGFNSNASVYLDGTKLVYESEKEDWGRVGKVVGCGFDPKQKKVFFTVDSEMVHVIRPKSKEFGTSLYPILAANIDVTVLVNFGQTRFGYAPANSQRTPNPWQVKPLVDAPGAAAPGLSYEDSRDMFSIGRADSGWLGHNGTRSSSASIIISNDKDHEMEEFESDLFEIVLDATDTSAVPLKP